MIRILKSDMKLISIQYYVIRNATLNGKNSSDPLPDA